MSVTAPRRPVAGLLADAAPYWWLAAALFAIVAAGALWRAYGPGAPRTYVSTASFSVVASPPPGAATNYDSAVAQERAVSAARAIAQGGLFHDAAFDAAVIAQLRQTARGAEHASADDVANALTATHAGNFVTLTARWPAPSAAALATATEQALEQRAASGQLPSGNDATPAQIVIQPAGGPSPATLDSDVESGRVHDLAARMIGGALVGLAAALAAGWLARRRTPTA